MQFHFLLASMLALGTTTLAQSPLSGLASSQSTQSPILAPSTRGPTTPVPTLRKMQSATPSSSATPGAGPGGMVNGMPSPEGSAFGGSF
ncbi:hypothetical protein N7452_011118 [Penicillium brevicompactum]|uniref:Uncharacterized protein n=1 Tax=Penicillium brevicompactum TaxID=5074 RepID=A0A9W9Q1X1_PENBR|nr:hypothetical protein N7452_011118 [Penicillium brevicompactum]